VYRFKIIFSLTPDFSGISFVESPVRKVSDKIYTEHFHTEDMGTDIILIYESIKNSILSLDPSIKVNPQKYYISLRQRRNFTFIDMKRKKLHIVIMLSYENGEKIIKKHKIIPLADSVQNFYNGSCFQVTLENNNNLEEIIAAIRESYKQQKKK